MSILKIGRTWALVPVMLACGCSMETATESDIGAGYEDVTEAFEPVVSPNGVSLNGVSLNGVSLNGVSLNGVSLNGVSLNGVSLNGVSLNGVSLNGISINGTTVNAISALGPLGGRIGGNSLLGAVFSGTLSDGSTLRLRIDGVGVGAVPNEDVYIYRVTYQTTDGWSPLCGVDLAGFPIMAVPVAGVWDYGSGVVGGGSYTPDPGRFTFGCRKTAIAKCVEMGYKPWKTLPSGTGTYQDHMVACTRMLRADYCGDGYSWTVNGTPINVYDGVGAQADTESWALEAEWTSNGATCMGSSVGRYTLRGSATPACSAALHTATCGALANFDAGTKLMNEY